MAYKYPLKRRREWNCGTRTGRGLGFRTRSDFSQLDILTREVRLRSGTLRELNREEYEFRWSVGVRELIEEKGELKLSSPPINLWDTEWSLMLKLADKDEDDNQLETGLVAFDISLEAVDGSDLNVTSSFTVEYNGVSQVKDFVDEDGDQFEIHWKDEVEDTVKITWTCKVTETLNHVRKVVSKSDRLDDLSNDLLLAKEDASTHDVTIVCGGEMIGAHKFILRARSPVFQSMFELDMVEKRESRVEIPDFRVEAVQGMLRWLYSGRLGPDEEELSLEVFKLADKYNIRLLKEECELIVASQLTIENAVDALILADQINADHLKGAAINFINKNKGELEDTPKFKNIPPKLFKEMYMAITE